MVNEGELEPVFEPVPFYDFRLLGFPQNELARAIVSSSN